MLAYASIGEKFHGVDIFSPCLLKQASDQISPSGYILSMLANLVVSVNGSSGKAKKNFAKRRAPSGGALAFFLFTVDKSRFMVYNIRCNGVKPR